MLIANFPQMTSVKLFMDLFRAPARLKERIMRYYEYLWLRNKGADVGNLFPNLPLPLRKNLSADIYQ
jgi:hypothetical protein